MEIRSRDNVSAIVEHEQVTVHELMPRWSAEELTRGTYIEFIDDFEISAGAKAEAHHHNTHEWYFVLEGEGVVQIEQEARAVKPGDLIYIPPNAPHTIWPTGGGSIRAFCFAASYQEPGGKGYTPADLAEVPVST